MSIKATKKQGIMKDSATHESDVGLSEVQVAILTECIKNLTEHLKIG
ncbi:MAG: 30S ribosomal protein S15 [Holosporales bacterium]|jgi:small subunit ribosomal protein S15|nr:30S ribosomal protein S15 [Holosporales bacterium]